MTKNDIAKRRVHSFEPDPDVAKLIDEAKGKGFKLGFIINAAIRKYAPRKLKGVA